MHSLCILLHNKLVIRVLPYADRLSDQLKKAAWLHSTCNNITKILST